MIMFHRKVRKEEAEVEPPAQQVNRKLDPSSLLTIQESTSGNNNSNSSIMNKKSSPVNSEDIEPKMTLRRRGIWCQYSSKSETVTLPLQNSTTYLPQEKDANDNNKISKQQQVTSGNGIPASLWSGKIMANGDNGDDLSGNNNNNTAEKGNKIFSITTSVLVIITIVTLVGLMCLCTCNKAVLVSAHYSSYGQNINSNSNNNNNNHQSANNAASRSSKMNRQGGTSQPIVYPQTTIASRSSRDADQQQLQQQQQQEAQVNEDRRHNSIDRFDSGEQIRPPLLRQPTTLPPLINNKPQQVSSDKEHNLQVAASQSDSYLSPEEREQLLRSQESHYEGKNSNNNNNNLEASASDQDRYDKPNSWSQPEGQYEGGSGSSGSIKGPGRSESRPMRTEAAASGGNSDADDGDYEDEPPESEQKRANLVPEIRRPTGSASYNHQRQLQRQRPSQSAASQPSGPSESSSNEESEPSDDYGGANDDVHFSRKSNQADSISSPLNLAASQHQQNRNVHSSYNSKQRNSPSSPTYEGGRGSSSSSNNNNNNNDGAPEEGPGFGPGPNEAYMADKAESGRPESSEEEGMGLTGGGSDPEGASASEEDNKLDRRAMNYPTGRSSNNHQHNNQLPHNGNSRVMYNNRGRQAQSAVDNGEPDSDEGLDSNGDESSPASAQSSKTEVKSRIGPNSLFNQRLSSVVPKTSASAPAPLSALSPLGSPPTYSLPLPVKSSSINNVRASPMPTSQPAIPFQRQQQQQQTYNQVNSLTTHLNNHHQKAVAANVPYNPQNNPSHAGKYFIN